MIRAGTAFEEAVPFFIEKKSLEKGVDNSG